VTDIAFRLDGTSIQWGWSSKIDLKYSYKYYFTIRMFRVAKIHNDAVIPKRGSAAAAGYDLYAVEDNVVQVGDRAMVDTGIAIDIPTDCYARVAPRSGLALKHGIDVLAGVVDADYRDSIRVILMNHGKLPFVVKKGDRIAQLVFERIYTPELECVDYDTLCKTDRGTGGFGSTGV
jgi:dUTP pyrophosphatase